MNFVPRGGSPNHRAGYSIRRTRARLSPAPQRTCEGAIHVKQQSQARAGWYATRTIPMPDADERGIEYVLVWIEHREDDRG